MAALQFIHVMNRLREPIATTRAPSRRASQENKRKVKRGDPDCESPRKRMIGKAYSGAKLDRREPSLN